MDLLTTAASVILIVNTQLCELIATATDPSVTDPYQDNSTERLVVSSERRLLNKIEDTYRRLGVIGRPVRNTSDPVNVKFGLGLIQMELEEKKNMMVMSAWTRYMWRDEYVTWDPSDFDGVTNIKIPSDMIWNPDIMLYNTATTEVYTRSALAVITHEGMVTWFPHRVFESSCSVNVRYFPFDNQTCSMYFGSWTHTIQEINLSLAFPYGIDLSTLDAEYNASSAWEVKSVIARRVTPDPSYVLLTFEVHLNRKMMFSSYILTAPAVFLSFLTLVVFALPVEDLEKSQLGLAIFGSLLLLLLIIVEAAPPTASAVPLLGIFYCFTTVIVIVSVFLTAIVVKVGNAGTTGGRTRPVPYLIRLVVIRGLGTLLCSRQRHYSSSHHLDNDYVEVDHLCNGYPSKRYTQNNHVTPSGGNDTDSRARSPLCEELCDQIQSIMGLFSAVLTRQRDRESQEERDKACLREWRIVASILDRFFFWVYLVAILLSIVFLFPWV